MPESYRDLEPRQGKPRQTNREDIIGPRGTVRGLFALIRAPGLLGIQHRLIDNIVKAPIYCPMKDCGSNNHTRYSCWKQNPSMGNIWTFGVGLKASKQKPCFPNQGPSRAQHSSPHARPKPPLRFGCCVLHRAKLTDP